MKTFIKTTLTAVALIATAASVQAGPKDVVQDERNNVIKNTFGNCVRTKWTADYDKCRDDMRESRTVYFDFDSSRLTPAARAKLDSLVDIIKNSSTIRSVNIVGYADRIGTSDYNYRLSQRRARAVQDYLAARGYYDTESTDVRSFGEEVSVSNCAGVKGNELKACLWRDRRVEIELNFAR